MVKISKHFSLEEFACKSIPYPEAWIEDRLTPLLEALEAIRMIFDAPIIITSGYRTEGHNRAVGGVKNSQHCQGRACDFVVKGVSPRLVVEKIRLMLNKIKITGLGNYKDFTHIDQRPGDRLCYWKK